MARPPAADNYPVQNETRKPAISRESLREMLLIFRYVRPYRLQFAAGLLFIGLSSLSTMAFPYMLKLLIDSANPGAATGRSGGILSWAMAPERLRWE